MTARLPATRKTPSRGSNPKRLDVTRVSLLPPPLPPSEDTDTEPIETFPITQDNDEKPLELQDTEGLSMQTLVSEGVRQPTDDSAIKVVRQAIDGLGGADLADFILTALKPKPQLASLVPKTRFTGKRYRYGGNRRYGYRRSGYRRYSFRRRRY
jgi:hypothetical protein